MVSFWHGRPWRDNPPRLELLCETCRREFKRTKSDAIAQGQKRHYCSVACRLLGASLWTPGGHRRA
jgi:hypothetical protein